MARATRRRVLDMPRHRRSGPADTPGGLYWGFGLLLPALLVVGGIICLGTDQLFLILARGRGVNLSGPLLDGVGIFALGLAALCHFGILWQLFPTQRVLRMSGIWAGGLTMTVGFLLVLF